MEFEDRRPRDIVIFTGLSASGKSTVAQKLSQEIDASVISLRQDVLHPVAVENGYARARFWVLATSEDPSLLDIERSRLAQVIELRSQTSNAEIVVIDDLIDPGTPQFLREYFNRSRISIILVKSNRHLRKRWIIKRTAGSDREALEEQKLLDGIKIKGGIFRAIGEANFRIRNMGTVDEAVAELKHILEDLTRDKKTDEV